MALLLLVAGEAVITDEDAGEQLQVGITPEGAAQLMRRGEPNKDSPEVLSQNSQKDVNFNSEGNQGIPAVHNRQPKDQAPTDVWNKAFGHNSDPGKHLKKKASCYRTENASVYAPGTKCPKGCPYWSKDTSNNKTCAFRCVAAADCASKNGKTHVADKQGFCRVCNIVSCAKCAASNQDKCNACKEGYHLNGGKCWSGWFYFRTGFFIILVALLIPIFIWLGHLRFCRNFTNRTGWEEGLAARERCQLNVTDTESIATDQIQETRRNVCPLSTNLMKTMVGGPGFLLHMRFQGFIILWALVVLICWMIFVEVVGRELYVIGLKPQETPQDACMNLHWAVAEKKKVAPGKAKFVVAVYVATSLASVIFAAWQKRNYHYLDNQTTSMRDFAAKLTGFPRFKGDEHHAEQQLKDAVSSLGGQPVVGVSVCWNHADRSEELVSIHEQDIAQMDIALNPVLDDNPDKDSELRQAAAPKAGFFGYMDRLVAGDLLGFDPDGKRYEATVPEQALELLRNIQSSDSAIIVFETETARDAAINAVNEKGSMMLADKQCTVSLEQCDADPDSVCFQNFDIGPETRSSNIVRACSTMGLFCLGWVVVAIIPNAMFLSSFTYANGDEPGFLTGFLFGLIVTLGQTFCFDLAARVSEAVGYVFVDDQQSLYIQLYLAAQYLLVGLDAVLIFWLTKQQLINNDAYTYGGDRIADLKSNFEVFQSYPMSKALGIQLYSYAFPATFLTGFILEPVLLTFLPSGVKSLLVLSNDAVRGLNAAKAMEFFAPFDLGRYGDIHVNMFLAVLVFLFPGGFTALMFVCLLVSHIYIYALDHWRALRAVPKFYYSSQTVDTTSNVLLGAVCALLAAISVLDANCLPDYPICMEASTVELTAVAAFVIHFVVHVLVVQRLLPHVCRDAKKASEQKYSVVARSEPCSWFTANPVHCLRSKYLHKQEPPCLYFIPGMEYLAKPNPNIGTYFAGASSKN
jgi:hypothetical protein